MDIAMKVTPTEALAMDRGELVVKLLDGEIEFDQKYIKRIPRIAWWGWVPHIVWDYEVSDGVSKLRIS